MSEYILDIQGLWIEAKSGGARVCGADLAVRRGECVGLVGESGSGKTLALRAALGILPRGLTARTSRHTLIGSEVGSLGEGELRRLLGEKVGYIPQNTTGFLHPLMRVRTQMTDGYLTWHPEQSRAAAYERARKLLGRTGIEDPRRVLDGYPSELSGGMRQRVDIAMALMGAPEFVVADEPTAALDSTTKLQVTETLVSLTRDMGSSLLLISHDLELVKSRCDRVYVMYAGRVVESGRAADVLARPEHPYTRALVDAVPRLGAFGARRLADLRGGMPEEGREADACVFAPRCPYAKDACVCAAPRLRDGRNGGGHRVACVADVPREERKDGGCDAGR